ncbi:MAG TPA: ubiquinol-cytochrome c reductase iron-sulfur subunit [Rhizobacter sp.]
MNASPTLVVTESDDPERRALLRLAGVAGAAGAAAMAVPFVSTLAPSERAKALGAAVDVDIGDLAPGQMKTVEWRGKPVWIVRRTPEMIAALADESGLADPLSQRDQQPAYARNRSRSIRDDVFVAVGICTHLGCSPSAVAAGQPHPGVPADWHGGYFCPCHGSTFDGAGRVYRNKPAPTNLEIPPYRFAGDTRLVIGDDGSA